MDRPNTAHSFVAFGDAQAALDEVFRLYDEAIKSIRDAWHNFTQGKTPREVVHAFYPCVRFKVHSQSRPPRGRSFGFVSAPGLYETTLTQPALYKGYYLEQFRLLLAHHGGALEIGVGNQRIPLHFALNSAELADIHLQQEQQVHWREWFDWPDLDAMDDSIANDTFEIAPGEPSPLALFTAARVDYSLHRLQHYTGTPVKCFQNHVLFTNYSFYVDEFVRVAKTQAQDPQSDCLAFISPDEQVLKKAYEAAPFTPRNPLSIQMPAYHLVRANGAGITLINIGVGPSNAKTITDHVAVLRPHTWIMLGHCAGLRNSQSLGDYVLAHGYMREDHVLDEDLPPWIPIPALAEIQQALANAVEEVTGCTGESLKTLLRTGTVASTDNRNWELLTHNALPRRLSQSRAVAIDMESATIAANGFRFRVPYGTLLCVSDKPLHGELKMAGTAQAFYRERVRQHLQIGLLAIEKLSKSNIDQLHSRKLRSFSEVAFQ